MINPGGPTPKRPFAPSMAYFLPARGGTGEVEYDDCKRNNTPALIIGMKKGDMAEIKATTAAWLVWQTWTQGPRGAGPRFDEQLRRQVDGVRMEGLGQQIFVCVGTKENIDHLTDRYRKKNYKEVHFETCQ